MNAFGAGHPADICYRVTMQIEEPRFRLVDTAGDPRVAVYAEMIALLGRAENPAVVLELVLAGLQRLFAPRGFIRLTTRGLEEGEYRVLGLRVAGGKEVVALHDPSIDPTALPVLRGGFVSDLIASPEPKLAHDLNAKDDPVFGDTFAKFGSVLAVPLHHSGAAQDWNLLFDPSPQAFDNDDLVEAMLRGNLMWSTVNNLAVMEALQQAHAWIQSEVDHIAELQRSLLPDQVPAIPGLALAAHYDTFDRAGGDYYDFIPANGAADGRWLIVIADAAGHGPSAAVVVAMLHALLHAYPAAPDSPSAVLEYVNSHLKERRVRFAFVTAWLGVYDPATRELAYARAGHELPFLRRADGSLSELDGSHGFPLGVLDEVDATDARLQLEVGDTVVLYTDGVTETRSPADKPLGTRGIRNALSECGGDATCAVESIQAAVRAHEAGRRPGDDQTVVVLQAI